MNLENKKLKAKKFWRDNERMIILLAVAFILGVTTASINYITYQDNLNKFELEGNQSITNDQIPEFNFQIEQPTLTNSPTIELTLTGVDTGVPLMVSLNGEDIREVTSNSATLQPSGDLLEEENTVTIRRTQTGFNQQSLDDARVTATTNFQQLMFVVLNLSSLLLVVAPILYVKYTQYKAQKAMEQKFPEFLRDVVEGTRAGMSLPQSIQNTETGSYGPLDERIEKMNAQLDWGIPFGQVLRTFGEETGSDVILRSVDTIIQAYQSGGNIQDVLESVGDNIRTLRQLKEERESQLYGEMITGYVVFFIFIGILVALTGYLLPSLASAQSSLGSSGGFSAFGGGSANLQENITLYESWFQRLVFIQAIFSGLIIGKLSEGELKAGFKHMGILFAIGYLAVTFFL
jgi:flagellar protein FlaJ